ncbi:DUF4199 domain-containing protein [Marinilabiliaceae bacterium ANBcel2]|nr:DUF4199 domain-containing protein [Marinilabiliaceae bacterium ANBcel2]
MSYFGIPRNQYILMSGAVLGIAQSLLLFILYLTGNLFGGASTFISLIIYLLLIYYAGVNYRDHYREGILSYGKSLGFGVKISILSGLFVGFFYFLLLTIIDPSLADYLIAETQDAYLAMGFSESEVANMQDAINMAGNPWMLFFSSIFNGLVYGFIVSLVVSIFVKRKGDPFKETMQNVE